MSKLLNGKKINAWYGIFFHIPVFLITSLGLRELVNSLFYSYTDFNMVETPLFVGFENYLNIFKDETIQKCLGNTVVMVLAVAGLLLVTAVLPAVFTAKLKLPFGLGVMGAFSVISLCAMAPGCFNIIFSSESGGVLNALLLTEEIIDRPIAFTQTYALGIAIVVQWLSCLAPVFSIAYIAARMKHSFLGTAIAVCAIPVLMLRGGSVVQGVVGLPSIEYSADWIYTVFNDYLMTRYEAGFAYAILAVGVIMLIVWCLLVCSAVFGLRVACKKFRPNSSLIKEVGYIFFAFPMLLCLAVFVFIALGFSKAFMPLHELYTFPPLLTPQDPTRENFHYLLRSLSNLFVPFSKYLYNSMVAVPLMILPVCLLVALPSGVGYGAFRVFKWQNLFLLCFIPFLFVAGYLSLTEWKVIDSYGGYVFEFLSSFEFLIAVFLVYLATRLVFYGGKVRVSGIVLGSFFVLSSFYALGVLRGIWHSSTAAIYSETLKPWRTIGDSLTAGGIARWNMIAANDLLMIQATLVVVLVPLALLLTMYLLYLRNTKKENSLSQE